MTAAQNVFAALVGAYMMVVPESMMVWKPDATDFPPTSADAPPICQKPSEDETEWNSIAPV